MRLREKHDWGKSNTSVDLCPIKIISPVTDGKLLAISFWGVIYNIYLFWTKNFLTENSHDRHRCPIPGDIYCAISIHGINYWFTECIILSTRKKNVFFNKNSVLLFSFLFFFALKRVTRDNIILYAYAFYCAQRKRYV